MVVEIIYNDSVVKTMFCFMVFILLMAWKTLNDSILQSLLVLDTETETQRGSVACLRSHRKRGTE